MTKLEWLSLSRSNSCSYRRMHEDGPATRDCLHYSHCLVIHIGTGKKACVVVIPAKGLILRENCAVNFLWSSHSIWTGHYPRTDAFK